MQLTKTNFIPKIIHQIWIGSKPSPTNLMDTWKYKNPDFEYIRWNEKEFIDRNMTFKCQDKIDEIEQIYGKADIIRWEILYKYGGIFIDADSICIEKIDDELLNKKCFSGWENEKMRPGLIATGTMGFPPKHPLIREIINYILKHDVSEAKTKMKPWQTTGPGLLTKIYNTGFFNDLHIFPSYLFLPHHFTNNKYEGHGKIYAYQEWGSTYNSYDSLNNKKLAIEFTNPPIENSISILLYSYNTKEIYLKECLDSIKHQIGWLNIEIICINDGSDDNYTKILNELLENFQKTTRFINVIYYKNDKKMGLDYSINLGLNMCSNEIIIKIESDNIMVNDRLIKQFNFMKNNSDIHICGSQMKLFSSNDDLNIDLNIDNTDINLKNKKLIYTTNYKSITYDNYKNYPYHFIINYPTLCFRKSFITNIESYNEDLNNTQHIELMLRILKKYKYIHNIEDILLYLRLNDKENIYNELIENHKS
jgi:mannosyltransferase OCH1-like enzyme